MSDFDQSVNLEQGHYLSNVAAVPGLKLVVERNSSMPKVGVLLVGGMYGSQPVGGRC